MHANVRGCPVVNGGDAKVHCAGGSGVDRPSALHTRRDSHAPSTTLPYFNIHLETKASIATRQQLGRVSP